MIDSTILSKMFKTNNIEYFNHKMYDYTVDSYIEYGFIEINVKNKKIVIFNNQSYFLGIVTLNTNCLQRKNCWILNSSKKTKPCLYFKEDYIRSIIRQKTINTLLND